MRLKSQDFRDLEKGPDSKEEMVFTKLNIQETKHGI